jgi:hypothetical protein
MHSLSVLKKNRGARSNLVTAPFRKGERGRLLRRSPPKEEVGREKKENPALLATGFF